MFANFKNKKMLTIASVIIALIVVIASLTIAWNKINKGNNEEVPISPIGDVLILNITGDRCKDGIEGNLTNSIQILEFTIALNPQGKAKEINLSMINWTNIDVQPTKNIANIIYISFTETLTTKVFNGTPGIWNNTTQSWDKEPIGNYTIKTIKVDYGTELNEKNASLFANYFFFAYSVRDDDNSFDNGDRIYDKDDKHIINSNDIIKIIVGIGIDDFIEPKDIMTIEIYPKENKDFMRSSYHSIYIPDFSNSSERYVYLYSPLMGT